MKLVTRDSIRAAYVLLCETAFKSVGMYPPNKVEFVSKKMHKFHGLCQSDPPKIWIDSSTQSLNRFIQIVAHEMIHLIMDKSADCDHGEHDENFNALARIIEKEMGWPKGSV